MSFAVVRGRTSLFNKVSANNLIRDGIWRVLRMTKIFGYFGFPQSNQRTPNIELLSGGLCCEVTYLKSMTFSKKDFTPHQSYD